MTFLVPTSNNLDAWVCAARYLLRTKGGEDANILLEIDDPVAFDSRWFGLVDPRVISHKGENPSDVANTIFPLRTWLNSTSRDEFYKRYLRAHARSHNKRWGTYFYRLISFGDAGVNQLERAINVLNSWKNEPGTALVFHLSSPEIDRPRPLGAPCLQLIQLQVRGGVIDMNATYRNHDYFNKALPNLVGLGKLLEFVCISSKRQPGRLVCHSAHAYTSAGIDGLNRLLARL